jgi:drug/metabolite transporter superfamily protein YnfA
MIARHILLIVGSVFLLFALQRTLQDRRIGPAARTWFLVGGIFVVVSLTLLR